MSVPVLPILQVRESSKGRQLITEPGLRSKWFGSALLVHYCFTYWLLSVWGVIAFLKIPTRLKTGLKMPCVFRDRMRLQTQCRAGIPSTWVLGGAVGCCTDGGQFLVVRDLTSGAHVAPGPHLFTRSGPPHHWHLTFPKLALGGDAILGEQVI